VADYKSALRLSDANLMLRKQQFECYVVELSNDDLKISQPYPFTETVWIEKGSFKIRKVLEHYVGTMNRRGSAPVTYLQRGSLLIPKLRLNAPIADSEFQFTAPADAKLVSEFLDTHGLGTPTNAAGRKSSNVMLRSVDGQRLELASLRGRPVLMNIWATWCAPCIAGFQELARLYEELEKTKMAIVSIDVSDDAKYRAGIRGEDALPVAEFPRSR